MAASGAHLVDEFENAFKNCLAALTNQEHYNSSEQDEVKTSVEQTIQKFLDVAKQNECYFLQKRMQLSITKPEQFIKEDANELKQELIRKDELIQKHNEKLAQWQAILNRSQANTAGTAGTSQQPATTQQAPIPHQGMQQQQSHTMMQQQQQHSQAGATQQQPMASHMTPHSAYQPQGPLHYLEQTTSNIGMPERR